jgi:hypothetical protein
VPVEASYTCGRLGASLSRLLQQLMAHAIRWLAQTLRLGLIEGRAPARDCSRATPFCRPGTLCSSPYLQARVIGYKQLGASINRASSQMAGGSKSSKPLLQVRPGYRAARKVKGTYSPLLFLGSRKEAFETYYAPF